MSETFGPLVGVIEQSTNSVRFLVIVAQTGEVVTYHQMEVNKIFPREGWIEQDPMLIYDSVLQCIEIVVKKLSPLGIDTHQIECIGLTNERESTVVWDKYTGQPLHNCIVWLDNRTNDLVDQLLDNIPGRDINWLKHKTGLPISTYFSAPKLKWLIECEPHLETAVKEDRLLFGTIDTWLIWKLTGRHLTDVTNASRTQLMDIETCEWDQYLLDFFHLPKNILPKIKSSADFFGNLNVSSLKGLPINGVISDISAALVGQKCFTRGQTNLTCGTGCHIIQNIGAGPIQRAMEGISLKSRTNLLTTVAFKLGNNPVHYALEGSVGIAGAAITWLRDNLEIVKNYSDLENIAKMQESSKGVYFVPAFQGLYAPYWDPNATGIILGFTQYSRKSHLVRATIDSIAYQANDILALLRPGISGIKIDGVMSYNSVLCQTLADITGSAFVRPNIIDTIALGAAMVAGHQSRIWNITEDLSKPVVNGINNETFNESTAEPTLNHLFSIEYNNNNNNNKSVDTSTDIFVPKMNEKLRMSRIDRWRSAVVRCQNWSRVEKEELKQEDYKRLSVLPFMAFALLSFGVHIVSNACHPVFQIN